MRLRRIFTVLVLAAYLLALVAGPVAAADRVSEAASHVRRYAGGWGLATPLMVAGVGVIQHLRGTEDWDSSDLTDPKLLGGLAGDFATVAIFNVIAGALPLSPLLRTYFVTFGGFLGWEIGSGNLAEADWLSMAAQAGAATAIHTGMSSLLAAAGLSLGGVPAAVLSIAGALAVAYVLDKLRGEPEAEASWGAPAASAASQDSPAAATTSPRAAARPDPEGYRRLVRALERGAREEARQAYRAYEDRARPAGP